MDYSQFSGFAGNPSNTAAANKKWWTTKKSDLAANITQICKTLQEADSPRQTQYQIDTRLYGNINMLGLEEITSNPENIIAIEWPERLGNSLPKEAMLIELLL